MCFPQPNIWNSPQVTVQMTGISPANQLLIIKGKEWNLEDHKLITTVWSPDDLVAISEKGAKYSGNYGLQLI